MKKTFLLCLVAAILAAIGFVSVRVWRASARAVDAVPPAPGVRNEPPAKSLPGVKSPEVPAAARGALVAEKRARVEKIRRDYEDIRAKMSAEYGAAGAAFPGGLNAFLKQLALLEREMRADFATVLTPGELEDYELVESTTGKSLQQRLAGGVVTEEQRRAVFRVQREFDERFALVFDVSPAALLERSKVQQVAWEKIRATLGDEAFAVWLRPDDPSYAALQALAAQQGLPAATVTELWRIKNEWTQRKLEIAAQAGLTADQRAVMQAALAEQTRSRVVVLVGTDAMLPGSEALGWVPPPR